MAETGTMLILYEVADIHGLKEFKKRVEAMSILNGNDTFVSLPGYGKSVIYTALPFVEDQMYGRNGSIVICVSPLTSLMKDQQDKFLPMGISTEFVGDMQIDETAVQHNR